MSVMQGGIPIHLRRVAQSDHAVFHFLREKYDQKLDSTSRFSVERWDRA